MALYGPQKFSGRGRIVDKVRWTFGVAAHESGHFRGYRPDTGSSAGGCYRLNCGLLAARVRAVPRDRIGRSHRPGRA